MSDSGGYRQVDLGPSRLHADGQQIAGILILRAQFVEHFSIGSSSAETIKEVVVDSLTAERNPSGNSADMIVAHQHRERRMMQKNNNALKSH